MPLLHLSETMSEVRGASCKPLYRRQNCVCCEWLDGHTLYSRLHFVGEPTRHVHVIREMLRDRIVYSISRHEDIVHISCFHRVLFQNPMGRQLWLLCNVPCKREPCVDVSRRPERLCGHWRFWCWHPGVGRGNRYAKTRITRQYVHVRQSLRRWNLARADITTNRTAQRNGRENSFGCPHQHDRDPIGRIEPCDFAQEVSRLSTSKDPTAHHEHDANT